MASPARSMQFTDAAPGGTHKAPYANLGAAERAVSVALGGIFGVAATQSKGPVGVLFGLIGGALVARGVSGSAPVKRLLGTEPDEQKYADKHGWSSAAKAPRSVTVNASRERVWEVLREVERWPSFMVNVKTASSEGERLVFTSTGPTGPVETRATITEDVPGERFAWESDKDAKVQNAAEFELRDAPGGRGTEIHAKIAYEPVGGSLGRYAAKLTQKEPGIELRRDLKRLKSLIEAGEVPTNARNRAELVSKAPKS
ncbi:SRPBCC family protein [Sphingosinicellaceae bacterium]|nr:SRPBCC family protein [Sphingosinicellaceae bacterium]